PAAPPAMHEPNTHGVDTNRFRPQHNAQARRARAPNSGSCSATVKLTFHLDQRGRSLGAGMPFCSSFASDGRKEKKHPTNSGQRPVLSFASPPSFSSPCLRAARNTARSSGQIGASRVFSFSDQPMERRRVPSSLPQQAATALVQQVSSVVIEQVISAATLNLACRTRKRRPPDNQLRGSRRTAMTV